MRKYCIGMVVKDRLDLTLKTLTSIYYTDQNKSTYDLIIIDNGSSKSTNDKLMEYADSDLLPIKNLITLEKEESISKAWNLFLALSTEYEYRVKMDNDLVLQGSFPVQNEKRVIPDTIKVDTTSSKPIRSPFAVRLNKKKTTKEHSSFLDHMYHFGVDNNIDLVSIVPVSPAQTFSSMLHEVLKVKRHGLPFLFGACMMLSKKCFDKLGYFDERLPRRIDIEYSQRALKNGFNIGYHPFYGAVHIGTGRSTEQRDIIQQKYQMADNIEKDSPPIDTRCGSKWEKIIPELVENCSNNKIMCLC